MKKIWVNGCFDIVHRGHIELFKYAKELGDYLVVGIDSDFRIKRSKGESRPINSQSDRKFLLESIQYIDKVVIFDNDDDLTSSINLYSPDIMIVGSDYKNKKVIGSEYAKKFLVTLFLPLNFLPIVDINPLFPKFGSQYKNLVLWNLLLLI